MSLGKNVKTLRLAKGMDQKDLERASGVAFGTISAIEVRNSKRSEHASALAQALGVPLEALISDDVTEWIEANTKTQKPPQTLQNTVNLSSVTVLFVPYLKKDEAGMYRDFLLGEREPSRLEMFTVPKGLEAIQAFSVTIEDDVMEPMLYKGVQVVIGAGVAHESGDAVFVKDGDGWIIRRLLIDGDSLYIDSPRTPPKPLKGEIVGPVISVVNNLVNLNDRLKGEK